MAYCLTRTVKDMLKPDVISSLVGANEYLTPEESEKRLLPYIEEAIADADAEINGYLCKRYPVPLTSVPDMITKLSKDIAIYNLMSRSGIDEGEREATYLARYKAAIAYLTKVAEGKLDLEQQGTANKPLQANLTFGFGSNKPLFTKGKMRGM